MVQLLHARNFLSGFKIFSEVLEASENPVRLLNAGAGRVGHLLEGKKQGSPRGSLVGSWLSQLERGFLAASLTPEVLKLGSMVQSQDHFWKVLPVSCWTRMQTVPALPVTFWSSESYFI